MSDQKTRPGKGNLQRYVSLLDKGKAVLGTLNLFTQVLRGHTFKPEAVGKAEYIVFYDAPTQPQNGWKILGGDYVQWWKLYHRTEPQFLEFASYCNTWTALAGLFGSDYFTTADLLLAIESGALTFNAEVFATAKAQLPQTAPAPKRERKGGQQKGKAQLPGAKVAPTTQLQPKAEPAPVTQVPLPVVAEDLKPPDQPAAVPAPVVNPAKPIVKAQPVAPPAVKQASPNGTTKIRQPAHSYADKPADLSCYDLPGEPVTDATAIMAGLVAIGKKVYQPLVQSLMAPVDVVMVKTGDGYQLINLKDLKPKKAAVVAEAPTKPAKQVTAPAPAEEAPARPRKARPAGQKAVLPK